MMTYSPECVEAFEAEFPDSHSGLYWNQDKNSFFWVGGEHDDSLMHRMATERMAMLEGYAANWGELKSLRAEVEAKAEPVEVMLGTGDKIVSDIYDTDGKWAGVGIFHGGNGIGVPMPELAGSQIRDLDPICLIRSTSAQSLRCLAQECGEAIERMDPAPRSTAEAHPDDQAVERFAAAMKEKLAKARAKGRGGWDDHDQCSDEDLSNMLLCHIGKGNPGNFEDIANFCMMLHQRGASPMTLAECFVSEADRHCIRGRESVSTAEAKAQALEEAGRDMVEHFKEQGLDMTMALAVQEGLRQRAEKLREEG